MAGKTPEYPLQLYDILIKYLQHLSTLCTGAVLLMVTLLEKLFTAPQWKLCIAVSLVSFALGVVASIAAQAGVIEQIDNPSTVGGWARPLSIAGFLGVWLFFLVGLASLVVFALKNLF